MCPTVTFLSMSMRVKIIFLLQVYLGEISEPRLRGLLIGTPFVAYSLGVLYVYALGGVLPWRSVAYLSIVLPALSFIALCLSPESPTWLARRGRFHDAMAAMACLRGNPDTVSIFFPCI